MEIRDRMKKYKSIRPALPKIVEVLRCSPSEYRLFSHKIGNTKWSGILYRTRNSLMGTIFSYFGNKVFIVPGYPKIRYSENTNCMNNNNTFEEKVDGTCLGLFYLPDGTFWGKTRGTTRIDVQGYKGRIYMDLFKETGLENEVQEAIIRRDDPFGSVVFGELYGKKNPGDFIRYSTDIGFKAFDILDLYNFSFLAPLPKKAVLSKYNVPSVKIFWEGILNEKSLSMLQFKLREHIKEDGMEGLVSKVWDVSVGDTKFGKIKTESIQELAWSLSPRKTVPKGFIAKAVRKAWENQELLKDKDEIMEFVSDELLEEFEESIVFSSKDKIKRYVADFFTRYLGDITNDAFRYLSRLERGDIEVSIDTKHQIMPLLANRFKGYDSSKLYNIFNAYLSKSE